jgi:hypothetical protein
MGAAVIPAGRTRGYSAERRERAAPPPDHGRRAATEAIGSASRPRHRAQVRAAHRLRSTRWANPQ